MNVALLLHTVRHLRGRQVVYQVRWRLRRARMRFVAAPEVTAVGNLVPWIGKAVCWKDGRFTFLNISDEFHGWGDARHGMLWAYNLNYMDWLCQPGISPEVGEEWIDRFIADLPVNSVGLDPYPIALRGINWVKFFCQHPEAATKPRLDSLYSQYRLLEKRLEYHLLGNHLLEDAYSLFIGSTFFGDERLYRKASKLLISQLREQTLADGAHYEQSPMYHCILLDRLLDCINIGQCCVRFSGQEAFVTELKATATKMLRHLAAIVYRDGTIPLLNDSAEGIAPQPSEIFAYAERLGVDCSGQSALRECGYRKFEGEGYEAIVDVGNITATYQPGHTHADTFNFEIRFDGQPFIVDTGISTYNKTSRRQYERSTAAHNTVTLADKDSSEVWGGFRVGNRAKVKITAESANSVTAEHNGFGNFGTHQRTIRAEAKAFCIQDKISKPTPAKAYLHFAPEVEVRYVSDSQIITSLGVVKITGADTVEITDGEVSREYNRLVQTKIAVAHFTQKLDVEITPASE